MKEIFSQILQSDTNHFTATARAGNKRATPKKSDSPRINGRRKNQEMKTSVIPARGGNHRHMALGNSLVVLEAIYRHASISQSQIVQVTDMQPSTVSNIIKELRTSGLVRECGALEALGVGAKQISLEVDASFAWAASWQIDLKGHQLCLLDAAGHVIVVEKFPLNLGWETIAKDIHLKIADLAEARRLPMKRFAGLGICVQGIVDSKTGEVLASEPHQMEAVPLKTIVSQNLKGLIKVERNIPCGAYYEQHIAAINRKDSFLYYLLRRHEEFFEHGTGIVLDGKLFRGSHSAAGELAIGTFPRPEVNRARTDQDWIEIYQSFGLPVATLADFLDVDGIIVSSDDPGLTDQRFQILQSAIEQNIRSVRGRTISIMRSQIGPEGMLLGAGLIVLHQYFQQFVQALPNRSISSKRKPQDHAR